MIKFYVEYTIVDTSIVSIRPMFCDDPTSNDAEKAMIVKLYELVEGMVMNKDEAADITRQIMDNMRKQ